MRLPLWTERMRKLGRRLLLWAERMRKPGQPKDLGDWSLRANGDTYLDRSNESEILAKRLESSASVTGIAGQRGAGKSSLALRVLENRSKEGAFTQLIHSPTGYDPREFLVTVFQRVCEEVVARIDRDFGQALSLQERGKSESRRLLGIFLGVILGACTVLIIPSALIIRQEIDRQTSLADLSSKKAQLSGVLSDLQRRLGDRLANLDAERTRFQDRLADLDAERTSLQDQDQLADLDAYRTRFQDQLAELDAYRTSLQNEPASLQGQLDELDAEYTRLQKQPILETSTDSGRLILFSLAMLMAYVIIIFLFLYLRRVWRRMHHARGSPRKAGLRDRALELSENLRFQTTLSTSAETGLSVLKATSKLSTGKSLVSRPLSLPGLTAEFAQFLERIGEVFSGSVVICLDELDKIEDPRDIDKLLRGIKGVLGWPGTHFLLTVSEDALARFTTQRRSERGMLESAFEDIIPLGRIDLKVADHVIGLMYHESDRIKRRER